MKRRCLSLGVMVMMVGLISACATYQPVPAFTPETITVGKHELKAENAVFIVDVSSSMGDGYQDWRKFDIGTSLVNNMFATLPDNMPINSSLRSFGHTLSLSRDVSLLLREMAPYDGKDMASALARVKEPGGPTYMGKAIASAGKDLEGLSGNSAIIIVSDGMSTGGNAVAAAKQLKAKMGSSLCIYTVLVGDEEAGRLQMQEIAEVGGCGKAVRGDDLVGGAEMAAFMRDVFVNELIDSDGDGVPDILDKCPGTPLGVKVDKNGCAITILSGQDDNWIFETITFDLNKATLKPASFPVLNEVAEAMILHRRDLNLVVEGHTDITGPMSFNMPLSRARAKTAMDYLISKGVSPDRLSSAGYGPNRPIADNNTIEGRAQNRRVQFTVKK
ncbi:OmpA family protein [Desulfosarcina sp. OttesenSCG-928-A07]|nr:OmpA family protein [Desulfosarcina sp. OttesenSCG-928-A07]